MAICLGVAFSHLITDSHVNAFLSGSHKKLQKSGLFVFDARNAKKISEDLLNRLLVQHISTENNQQLLLLTYNTRDAKDPNIIVWKPIHLTNENGKTDMQIREHKLRWFEPKELERLLARNRFEVRNNTRAQTRQPSTKTNTPECGS